MKDSKGHRIRYTQCVDWFSFGCVIYEMIIGFSPFRSEGIYEWSGLTKKDKVGWSAAGIIGFVACLCFACFTPPTHHHYNPQCNRSTRRSTWR